MIITEKKPVEDILKYTEPGDKIFIIGCAQCATTCATGGEREVAEIEKILIEQGRNITGKTILDPPCDERISRIELKKQTAAIAECAIILILACGAGVSVIAEIASDKKIIAGLDGVFLGSLKRLGVYNEYCSLCGDCVLSRTGGICPVTRCAKGLLNGPCGGTVNGRYCEVNPERDCAWQLIIEKLKKIGCLDNIKTIQQPKDYGKYYKPNKFNKR